MSIKADVELALYLISLATVDKDKRVQKEGLNHAPVVLWLHGVVCSLTSISPVVSSSVDVFQVKRLNIFHCMYISESE